MKIMQLPRSVCGLKTTGTGPFDWAQAYVAFLERYGIIGVWSTLASQDGESEAAGCGLETKVQ
jgi:hypothetical protein